MTRSDDVIDALGGCGRYQIKLSVLIHLLKTLACWSTVAVIIIFKTPDFWCVDDVTSGNMSDFWSSNMSERMEKSCINTNGSKCSRFWFDPVMDTMVNKFDLICDKAFLSSLTVSIQGAGMLIGNTASGQLADLFGRKYPLFSGLAIITTAHCVAIFSINWTMFAVTRFLIGLGAGFFLTVQYNLMSEFCPARWRTWVIGFPAWQIETCLLVLVAWLTHHWDYLHIAITAIGLLSFFSIFCIPESFRWLLTHNEHDKARATLQKIAKENKRPLPDIEPLVSELQENGQRKTKYTFIHLFSSKRPVKTTLILIFAWLTHGVVAQGLTFGIQALSGNVYINMLLFNIAAIPGKLVTSVLQNRFGRRNIAIVSYISIAITGLMAGIIQQSDTSISGPLTNGLALCAYLGVTSAWGPIQTMTVELYPTVIRTLAFGTMSTIGRIGAIAGPQLVYLDTLWPGVLFFACSLMSLCCVIAIAFLPETMNAGLADRIKMAAPVEHNTSQI